MNKVDKGKIFDDYQREIGPWQEWGSQDVAGFYAAVRKAELMDEQNPGGEYGNKNEIRGRQN